MKVSIITVTYNSVNTLNDTIQSVFNQTYSDIEYIVIDGNSSDGTIDVIRDNQNIVSKWVSESDQGIYDAMNKGLKMATGDIIGIINADDFYADERVVEDMVQLFKATNCDVCYADLDYVEENDLDRIQRKWKAGKYKEGSFYNGWMPPHPTVFIKKNVYEKYGNFNLELGTAADYEIMLRFIHKNNIKVEYLPRTLIKMRTGGASNATIFNRIKANSNDRKAWKVNNLKPRFYTLTLKPLRKITQFF